jgi:TonB family protein
VSLRAAMLLFTVALGNGAQAAQTVDFDIPAQPLAAALNAFGAATRVPIFVDAELTSGRRSIALKGAFTPEAGLQSLLAGTGLAASPVEGQGFTLALLPLSGEGSAAVVGDSISPSVLRFGAYSAAIQGALQSTICLRAETRPGTYRTLVSLWITPTGSVNRAELLTSTGDAGRDVVLSDALRNLEMGAPPPPGMPQPVTILLAPGAETAVNYCTVGDVSPNRKAASRKEMR